MSRIFSLSRAPQLMGAFEPGDPGSGYYKDLRGVALEHRSPEAALQSLRTTTRDRRLANPVSVAQLGLGAWQVGLEDARWLPVIAATSDWLVAEQDGEGGIPYLFALPHTYRLDPPWYSAMAQGEAASLLIRAAAALERPELTDAALVAVRSLVEEGLGLVTETPEGPVLQEYPTDPPAHVLNGWISALWGLYDVSLAAGDRHREVAAGCRSAFARGADVLEARLSRYDAGLGWSRYDLYPHRIAHVASPFYHRLHIEQLRAMARLSPRLAFREVAARWEAGARRPVSRATGLARKVAFRLLEPRRRPV